VSNRCKRHREYAVLDMGRDAARSHRRRRGYRVGVMRGPSRGILPDTGWV